MIKHSERAENVGLVITGIAIAVILLCDNFGVLA